MNIFLLVFATVFFSIMFGAAVIGAFLAAFLILLFFSLTALGFVSTAVAIGIYKRSLTSGFKSLFVLFFGLASAVLGAAGLFVVNLFIPIHLPAGYLIPIGFAGGLAGGLLLGRILFYIVKELIAALARGLKIA
ncbi:hypothetical protein HRG84_10585 [Flavisolibacter sp. BT320]|nr:hypothetical protein [Flavisolibacter longurius]